eukprot:scaffold5149_cov71-Phaeocystis_antarctica.AAC.3
MNCRPPMVASRTRRAARASRPTSCGPCTRRSTSLPARLGLPRRSAAHRANSSPSAIEGTEAAVAAAATAAAVTATATRARSAKAGARTRCVASRRVSETKSREDRSIGAARRELWIAPWIATESTVSRRAGALVLRGLRAGRAPVEQAPIRSFASWARRGPPCTTHGTHRDGRRRRRGYRFHRANPARV